MSDPQLHKGLLDAALSAANKAYAPYSNYRVGAAVLADGEIITGANVENGSYGLTICAERVALAKAITEGKKNITHIALACLDDPSGSCLPCGACRQWMAELAPKAVVIVCGREETFTVEELLPGAFRLER